MKTIIRNSIRGLLLIPLLFVCFGLLPAARAVTPAPDGGYPGFNTAEGQFSLLNLDTSAGLGNTAIGFAALKFVSTGDNNTAVGVNALLFNTDAIQNTAVGQGALQHNNASGETAVGFQALAGNTTGIQNVATGFKALAANLNGNANAAHGYQALLSNTGGTNNAAVGAFALQDNVNGGANCAVGFGALANSNTSFNNAVGFEALVLNTSGVVNNAFGSTALFNNGTGGHNSGFGDRALINNVSGSFNTAIGDRAGEGITGSGNVCIGAGVFGVGGGANNHTYIKNVWFEFQPYIAGTNDVVTVRSDGRLGYAQNVAVSSRRYKHDIKPMDKASEALFALKPVTFRYNKDLDPSEHPQWGLVAEEVEQLNPDLVTYSRNDKSKVEGVRYEAINAMLLNEFLKEHQKVEEQQASIAELKSTVALQQKGMEVLTAQLKEQASQIQKVSAQLEVNRPTPKVVVNTP